MKINLNVNIKGLDGNDIPDANMGKIIAGLLSQATKVDSVKFLGWAFKLYQGEELELDKSDFNTIKTYVENSELPTLTRGQFSTLMDSFKE